MKLKFRADLKDIVIFLIFCLVLLYLIAIAVLNLNSVAVDGTFRGLNPLPAFTSEFITATLLFYVLALVAIFTACSSYFFEREEGFGITTQKKSKNDGYSKLMSEKDMKKDYGIKKVHLKDDTYEAGGIPVINDGKDAWVDASGQPHSLIMGASGSGKTQAFMFPLIKILGRAGESMIVTDPKGELYEACGSLLKEKGYKIILINFRDPREGAAWNPFSYPYRIYKEGNSDKANELLQDLASNILIDPNNKAEPFWEQTASNFFTGLSLGLFDDATEAEININSINMMAETGEDRIGASTYIKEYFKSKGELSPAYIAAASCINAPNETRGGIMSTFRTKTRIFSSQVALSEMLSYSDFDIRDVGKEKTAVFLKIHDEKTTYHALATIFVKQAYEALIAVAQTCPNLKLPYRTNFILDEFANMPALKDVETMITASRSRNIRFSFVIQNFSQLNKVYGKDVAETIKGNCGNFVYIMSTELAALEEISKLLGDQKPAKAEKDKPAPPIRPLFTVSDLQALKEGEVIINRFRSMPFKTKLVYDYKIDWGKKYEQMQYTERPRKEVKVFDLKGYVTKLKESQGETAGPSPMGMPGMVNPYMPAGMAPGVSRSAGVMPTSLDDYVKRLDEKIAELEREEAEEKAKAEREKSEPKVVENVTNNVTNNYTTVPLTEKTEEELEKEIGEIFDHKLKEPEKEKVEDLDFNKFIVPMPEDVDDEYTTEAPETTTRFEQVVEEPIKVSVEDATKEEIPTEIPRFTSPYAHNQVQSEVQTVEPKPENTIENIEKPKVNIDVDSVVVNNKPNDEDFFDDFFGSEDE
ncbi:MAG: type IV secretory system conjugative DNA transfer family protein [Bacilli bacterium]|nr:type IV secretory system conjugative DNA transfer family protein [Bacilli bacterium]